MNKKHGWSCVFCVLIIKGRRKKRLDGKSIKPFYCLTLFEQEIEKVFRGFVEKSAVYFVYLTRVREGCVVLF